MSSRMFQRRVAKLEEVIDNLLELSEEHLLKKARAVSLIKESFNHLSPEQKSVLVTFTEKPQPMTIGEAMDNASDMIAGIFDDVEALHDVVEDQTLEQFLTATEDALEIFVAPVWAH